MEYFWYIAAALGAGIDRKVAAMLILNYWEMISAYL